MKANVVELRNPALTAAAAAVVVIARKAAKTATYALVNWLAVSANLKWIIIVLINGNTLFLFIINTDILELPF